MRKSEEIKAEWITLTPKLAEEFLEHNEGNRRPKKAAQSMYVEDMVHGAWLTTGQPLQFDSTGRMIDGQNRCQAVIDSNTSIKALVVTGLDPQVQAVIDTNARRTAADALGFAGYSKYPTLVGSVARYATTYMKGNLRTTDSRPIQMTNSAIVQWQRDNAETIGYAAEQAKGLKITGLSPSVMAFGIWLTHQLNPEASDQFWSSLHDKSTDGEGDPRWHLLDLLTRNAQHLNSVRSRASVQTYLVLKAWNAWRTGEKITGFRTPATGTRAFKIPQFDELEH